MSCPYSRFAHHITSRLRFAIASHEGHTAKSRDFGQQQGYTFYRNKKKQWKKQVGDDVTLVPDGPGRLEIDLFPQPAPTYM